MLSLILLVIVVSLALIGGAVWGAFRQIGQSLEGALLGVAAGALIVSVMSELIEPASEHTSLVVVLLAVSFGAILFTFVDWIVDEKWGSDNGGGLLASIIIDGIPESLALGVVLIGAGASEVAAFAASIFLSNLPEAANGSQRMVSSGMSKKNAVGLWTITAAFLAGATVLGYLVFDPAAQDTVAAIQCVAAGAVLASLATEVIPKAFNDSARRAGLYVTAGVLLAFSIHTLAR